MPYLPFTRVRNRRAVTTRTTRRPAHRSAPASPRSSAARAAGRSARILAPWNGGTPVEVKRCTSDVVSRPRALTLGVPAGAADVSFRFHETGGNNGYRVIDGVKVTAA